MFVLSTTQTIFLIVSIVNTAVRVILLYVIQIMSSHQFSLRVITCITGLKGSYKLNRDLFNFLLLSN